MRTLITSTAIALALATSAYAETHAASPFIPTVDAQAHYASELVGARLYVSETEIGDDVGEVSKDWEDVGEIHDIVVGNDGQILAVLADIGGFLGIGEKQIALTMGDLHFVRDGDDRDDYFVVVQSSRDMLENAPVFEWQRDEAMATDAAMQTEQPAGTEMSNETAAAANVTEENVEAEVTEETAVEAEDPARTDMTQDTALRSSERDYRFTPPAIEREGFEAAAVEKLTTEDVTGARVYDAKDEWIGEVHTIVLDDTGKLGDAIIDVGGFLGIGEKRVAVNFEEMTLQRGTDNDELRIYVDATKEQLENLPEVEVE